MYSVVLMMAMTTGVDSPDCHRAAGCCGCTGVVAAGCHGGLFHKHHGCTGCTGCTGYAPVPVMGCSGCMGAPVGCTGCYGAALPSMGCSGVMVAAGGYTGTTVIASANSAARLVVSLPVDATLSVDGTTTRSTSSERVFMSPPLPAGREYSYTLTAEYMQDGKPVSVTKTVYISAGAQIHVDLGTSEAAGLASR